MICPHQITDWSKSTAEAVCHYHETGVIASKVLKKLLKNPLKTFLVRFIDDSRKTHQTSTLWSDTVKNIAADPVFQVNLFLIKTLMSGRSCLF